jgi:SulP family sulfate permease
MALAALLYIRRISETTTVSTVTPGYIEDGRAHILQDKDVPPYVTILRIHGPFMFGTTEQLADVTANLSTFCPIIILRLRNMTAIDATGLHSLEIFCDRLKKSGRTLVLCGARDQPARFLQQAEFIDHIGKDNIQPHVQAAIQRARQIFEDFGGVGQEIAHDLAKARM